MLQQTHQNTQNDNPIQTFSLQEVLLYKNKSLIMKFRECYNVTIEESEDIFTETKKFLYLCANRNITNLAIYEPMLIIDEMWHMFILFTKDYFKFCKKYFGFYIHHLPKTQEKNISSTIKNDFKKQRSMISEILGKDTAEKWYNEYPTKYSIDNLNNIRKPFKSKKHQGKYKNINFKLCKECYGTCTDECEGSGCVVVE